MRRLLAMLLSVALAGTCAGATLNDHIKAGVPSPDRPWYGTDYQRLAELVVSGKVPLPMLNSEDTRPIFLAMVSRRGLSFYGNRDIPLNDRMPDCIALYGSVSTLLKKYLQQHNERHIDSSRELARMTAHALYLSTAMNSLLEEFLPTIQRDDKYEIRMDGLRKVKDGLATFWGGAMLSLTERTIYADEDILIMANAMAENIVSQQKLLGEKNLLEIQTRAEELIKKEKNEDIKAALKQIVDGSKAPLGKAAN